MGYLRTRMLLLWCGLSAMLILGIVWWHGQEKDRLDVLFEQTKVRYTEAADGILQLSGVGIEAFVSDYSYWDDMVSFVRNGNLEWARENLNEGMSTFGAAAVAVFDKEGRPVYSATAEQDAETRMLSLTPDRIRSLFQGGPFCHFYTDTPYGLWEVRGAAITYTSDADRRLPAQGYFFAGKLWDSAHVSRLEELLRARLSVEAPSKMAHEEISRDKAKVIYVHKPLLGSDGKPVRTLCITRQFQEGILAQAAARKTLGMVIGFALVMMAALYLTLSLLVMRPVRALTGAMEAGNTESLAGIGNPKSEFGRLGKLMSQFFQQKAQLQAERDERARTAEALRESEELLSATLRSIGEGVISTDAAGNVTGVNPSAEYLTGWSLQEVQGRPIEEVLHIVKSGTDALQDNPIRHALTERRAVELADETELIARDGTRRQIADSCSPIRSTDGEVLGAVLVFRDVTEEYRGREKLRTSEERFAQIAEQSGEMIWEVNADGLYTYVSHACETVLGYTEEEVVGRLHFYDLHPEEGREDFRQGAFSAFDQKAVFEDYRHRLLSKDGRVLEIVTNGVPILNSSGELLGYRGSDRDITDQVRAEQRLKETNAIVNRSPIAVFLWRNEPGWPVEMVTENVKQLSGYTALDFTSGKICFAEVVHPEDLERVGKEVAEYSSERGRTEFVQDYRLVTKDGTIKWVEDRTFVRRDESGRVTHYQGIVFDITARRRAEEELLFRNNFERVVSAISSRFVGNEEERDAINASLADVGRLTGASRAYLYTMDADREHMSNVHEWCAEGISPNIEQQQGLPTAKFPWWMAKLQAGEIVDIGDVSAMPPEATAEREILEAYGAESVRVLPLLVQGQVEGFVGLDNATVAKDWPEDSTKLLQVCAGIFATYLERKQAERELKRLNEDLHIALSQTQEYAVRADMARAEAMEKAQVLDHQSAHDTLTDLPNRKYFERQIGDLVETKRRRSGAGFYVLFMDLDKFKLINDTMGHSVGDLLLVEVASRLRACVRSGDFLARMGGDEFTAAITCSDRAPVESVANRILDSISRPFVIRGHRFVVGISVGIAAFPNDGSDVSSLMKHADAAMYRAKQAGRGTFRWYTGDVDADNQTRMMLESDLLAALDEEQFVVLYQPIIDLQKGGLQGAEALLRWEHPEKGMISPSIFIPLAEETGLIRPIGEHVLRKACAQMREWLDEGLQIKQIGVNVSGVQIREDGWVGSIQSALADSGLDPQNLNIEITESELATTHDNLAKRIWEVRDTGVSVAIDDFGMGQSSLSRLREFPVIHLKIDGSFLRDVERSDTDKAMLQSIIKMAQGQGIQVTAEWVETEAQLAFLKASGCDYAQGYAISKPVRADELRRFALESPFAGTNARQAA